MNIVVHTQGIENYGAHCEDGKFSSGNAYWKFKGGTTYIVQDVDREQDAVAFVMAAFSENDIGWKEFPTHWESEQEWLMGMADDDQDYQDFKQEHALVVSPNTMGVPTLPYKQKKEVA
tara:strand:- start:2365 stop:2718 length:354 start_codon:yes stop_codon:yes gene_type:complete